jgi:hypothetical protein
MQILLANALGQGVLRCGKWKMKMIGKYANSMFFETLHLWMMVFVSSLLISFSDFLIRFALFS